MRIVHGVALRLREPVDIVVRGEIYMTKAEFAAINAERAKLGEEPFKNPRNTAAGTIKQMDPREVAKRPMRTILYEVVDGERYATRPPRVARLHPRLGLPVSPHNASAADWDALLACVHAWQDKRDDLPYEVDGLVIKVDDFAPALGARHDLEVPALGDRLQVPGAPGHDDHPRPRAQHRPHRRGHAGRGARSRRRLGHDGVARVGPQLGSGRSASASARGDRVLIEKAGEIIPQILGVTEKGDGPGVRGADRRARRAAARSSARRARSRSRARTGSAARRSSSRAIEFFASRGQMNIDGLGEKVVAQLVDAGPRAATSPTSSRSPSEQLAHLDRFAEQSAKNLVAAIAKAKQAATFSRLLAALGIPHVGGVVGEADRAEVRRLSALRAAAAAKESEAVRRGARGDRGHRRDRSRSPSTASCATRTSRRCSTSSSQRGIDPAEPVVQTSDGPLAGKTLVVTGTLSAPRAEIQKRIEAAGGKVAGSVSKKTSYLVAGADTGKTKLDAAQKNGVQVIDEAELEKLLTS